MELDLQSLVGLHVYSCTHWLTPHNPPPPPPRHLGSYTRALLVSQDRRHLSVTPGSHVYFILCSSSVIYVIASHSFWALFWKTTGLFFFSQFIIFFVLRFTATDSHGQTTFNDKILQTRSQELISPSPPCHIPAHPPSLCPVQTNLYC